MTAPGFEAIAVMGAEGLPTRPGCRVLAVSESGFYAWRSRLPSARAARRAWLTDTIAQIHATSNGVYGSPRVHAEHRLARGIVVGHGTVEKLMRHAGIKGLPYNRPRRTVPQVSTADDLVDRDFHQDAPNRLRVTDITEHPTREGKVYCCVIPDAYARRAVGWSIDHTQTSTLVTNALNMAIQNRRPAPGGLIHSDHEVHAIKPRDSATSSIFCRV